MANNFTKSSAIFDRSKVGPGDIIEFSQYSDVSLFGKPKLLYKRVGIVERVEPETIWIHSQDPSFVLDCFGIPVDRAEDLRMVYKSYYNVKEGADYGEPETDN
jgi:hypothetical protein